LDSKDIAEANGTALKLRAEWKALVEQRWTADWITWMEQALEGDYLETLVEFVGRLDAECALASVAEAYGYVRPIYVASTDEVPSAVRIQGLRHPIIERITEVPYISHSLSFGGFEGDESTEQVAASPCGMLLYGVNASGKSSLGKALGLAVLMAQCGMPVPATAMTLVPYTALFTRILGNDNLWAGMSSFVVEMTEFRSILRSAGPRTLVIGDELCAGTETASATAIVAACGVVGSFAGGALLIGTLIAALALASLIPGISRVLLFWLAFVLTRPFGAFTVDLNPSHLAVRRIEFRSGEFHPGPVIADFALAEAPTSPKITP
jgi:hypothetical protein